MASDDAILHANPYAAHPALSAPEADALWEYAKLAHHVQRATRTTRALAAAPDARLLARLRVLETKMGLVLTLFRASVWGVINEQPAPPPGAADTTPRA